MKHPEDAAYQLSNDYVCQVEDIYMANLMREIATQKQHAERCGCPNCRKLYESLCDEQAAEFNRTLPRAIVQYPKGTFPLEVRVRRVLDDNGQDDYEIDQGSGKKYPHEGDVDPDDKGNDPWKGSQDGFGPGLPT